MPPQLCRHVSVPVRILDRKMNLGVRTIFDESEFVLFIYIYLYFFPSKLLHGPLLHYLMTGWSRTTRKGFADHIWPPVADPCHSTTGLHDFSVISSWVRTNFSAGDCFRAR